MEDNRSKNKLFANHTMQIGTKKEPMTYGFAEAIADATYLANSYITLHPSPRLSDEVKKKCVDCSSDMLWILHILEKHTPENTPDKETILATITKQKKFMMENKIIAAVDYEFLPALRYLEKFVETTPN